jgi:hypothetical protein
MTTMIDIARVVALFGAVVFAVTYHLLAPWWRSQIGQNLMTMTGGVALLLLLGVARTVLAPGAPAVDAYFGQSVLVLLAFLALGVAFWWRWVLLIRQQVPRCTDERG